MAYRVHSFAVHTTFPETTRAEPLRIIITGVNGNVQYRAAVDRLWKQAQVNSQRGPGAETRTGPRSAVQFRIPPDQVITFDRQGTMKVINLIETTETKVEVGSWYEIRLHPLLH